MIPFRMSSFWFRTGTKVEDIEQPLIPATGSVGFELRRFLRFLGPSFIACAAFIDPGNLEADLQTGAGTGYTLLWVLFWSTVMGGLLQTLASKLGVATGKHLAQHCRDNYPRPVRITLWLITELAIVGADQQAVIGTAIALSLLTQCSLSFGVIATVLATYVLLMLERLGPRVIEGFFQGLLVLLGVSMLILFRSADVPLVEVARGLILPKIGAKSLPVAAALLGSILMPHNLFLHSALVHARPVERQEENTSRSHHLREAIMYYTLEAILVLSATLCINVAVISIFAKGFFGKDDDIGLRNAGTYLGDQFGKHMEVIWAIGLLAAGSTSTMSGTLAGQHVMSGYLRLYWSPLKRALFTRAVALGPTLLVAFASDKSGKYDDTSLDALSQWVNILQSITLPFAVLPLVTFTSSRQIMGAREFKNGRLMALAASVIATAIITVNVGAVWQSAHVYILSKDTLFYKIVFWVIALFYLSFVGYLLHFAWHLLSRDHTQPEVDGEETDDDDDVDEDETVSSSNEEDQDSM